MTELKKIFIKVLMLIADILFFSFNTIRQIALPNRQRKGNLLSSLFIFFVGIVEQLNCFEHGFFSMTALFRKKYIRQIIFIIGGILFLLTLFEWSGDQRLTGNQVRSYSEQLLPNAVNGASEVKSAKVIIPEVKSKGRREIFTLTSNGYNSYTHSLPVKKFLFLQCLRV